MAAAAKDGEKEIASVPKVDANFQTRLEVFDSLRNNQKPAADLHITTHLDLCVLLKAKGLQNQWLYLLDKAQIDGNCLISMAKNSRDRTNATTHWSFFTKKGLKDITQINILEQVVANWEKVCNIFIYIYIYIYL